MDVHNETQVGRRINFCRYAMGEPYILALPKKLGEHGLSARRFR